MTRSEFALKSGVGPLLFSSEETTGSLMELFQERKEELLDRAARHGSVLFRGFELKDRISFDRFTKAVAQPLDYTHGNSPRTRLSDAVYTSTESPPDYTISFHNELS